MKNFSPHISELTEISEIQNTPDLAWRPEWQHPFDLRGWILYDGDCQFCIAAANRFQHLFARRGFVFLPLQTGWVQRRLGLVPGAPLEEMRVLTIEGDDYGGADAVLFLARQIWWLWPIAWFGKLPLLHRAVDFAYRWIAARRGCTHLQCNWNPALRRGLKERRSPVRRLTDCSATGKSLSKENSSSGLPAPEFHLNRRPGDRRSLTTPLIAWIPPLFILTSALIARPFVEPWAFMWLMVGTVFLSAKWLTLQHAKQKHRASALWELAYLLLWPGMDAGSFLAGKRRSESHSDHLPNITGVLAKIFIGALLLWGVARHLANDLLAGWIGMIGLILMIHFGLFSLAAVCWHFLGYPARPIMNAPWKAALLSDFWGRRWNRAFQQLVIGTLFRPLAGRIGVVRGTLLTFFISGLLHELVISLPAGAGYGLPTAYFLLQGWGVIVQRTPIAGQVRFSNGFSGRLFTLFLVGAPAFFLFHPPFVGGVIVPFLHAIRAL